MTPPSHTRQQLIQWATGCMWEGLPDTFFSAWLAYRRDAPDRLLLDYQYQPTEGAAAQPFQPGDELYPARCIELMDAFLPEDQRDWLACRLTFNPQAVTVDYTYPPR